MSILLSLISYCTVWKLYERCFGPSNFNSNTTLSRVEVNVFISTRICTHTKMQYCNVYTGIKRCSHSDTPPSTLQVNCLLTSCLFDDSGVIESLGDQKKIVAIILPLSLCIKVQSLSLSYYSITQPMQCEKWICYLAIALPFFLRSDEHFHFLNLVGLRRELLQK